LAWEDFAAVPESYATAWTALHENMAFKPGDVVLIRGGTSALGQAAINIAARTTDTVVIASTRNADSADLLRSLGARHVLIEDGAVSHAVRALYPDGIDSVMDIVGNSTLLDSLKAVKKGGVVCNAGFLGGGAPISFNPLADMPSSVNLNFFASFNLGSKDFPCSRIPMQDILDKVSQGIYQAKPKAVFGFHELRAAHDLMESDTVRGKIVVRMGDAGAAA
ncbi:MAG: zinc-binding dehydrogenase, partial [Gammaproteobacteria bacterium]